MKAIRILVGSVYEIRSIISRCCLKCYILSVCHCGNYLLSFTIVLQFDEVSLKIEFLFDDFFTSSIALLDYPIDAGHCA